MGLIKQILPFQQEWDHLEAQNLLQGSGSVFDGLLGPLSLLLSACAGKLLLCPRLCTYTVQPLQLAY